MSTVELDRSGTSSACVDGNEAAASVAYALSEVIAIYPITPASPMGEHADAWSADGRPNLWGAVPEVVEMQCEAGAAGALHGALRPGALATTFTASQGLLLMLPEHVQDRRRADAGRHPRRRPRDRDARAVDLRRPQRRDGRPHDRLGDARAPARCRRRTTSRSSPTRPRCAPGSRSCTSSTASAPRTRSNTIDAARRRRPARADRRGLVAAHRARGSTRPPGAAGHGAEPRRVLPGARGRATRSTTPCPAIVAETFDRLAARTGRQYGLVDYAGAPDAERVVVLMGSGAGAAERGGRGADAPTASRSAWSGAPVPPVPDGRSSSPASRPLCATVAVLDRTKEPGALGEPLLPGRGDGPRRGRPTQSDADGDRRALRPGSKEFTPAMVKAVFDELTQPTPERRFTVGIVDDVTPPRACRDDPSFRTDDARRAGRLLRPRQRRHGRAPTRTR